MVWVLWNLCQLQVFREEVQRSEQLQKPLFLHCIRAIDDVLRIRNEVRITQPWIWHGYRSTAQQLQQLFQQKIYFSFGTYLLPSADGTFSSPKNIEALLACPAERLLLETDEDIQHSIVLLYKLVAQLRGVSVNSLIRLTHQNFRTLFED